MGDSPNRRNHMFKTLYRCARTAARHENGPAARSRLAYLEHLAAGGATLHCLRANAGVLYRAAGYYAANDTNRSLVPVSRLQAWIEQNVYLSLKSVPFSKDDETLVPEASSCANCPKRTGFNTLLFSEVNEDSCADTACFNRKLDAHITQRITKMPNLVQISENYRTTGETPILGRRNYVEVVTRRGKKHREAR